MLSRKRAAELLYEAANLINGPRAQAYGEPQQSFENIAKHWSAYLGHEITVTDVGMMMILLKVSRNGRDPARAQRDNFTDICGYASLTGGYLPSDEEKALKMNLQKEDSLVKAQRALDEEIKQELRAKEAKSKYQGIGFDDFAVSKVYVKKDPAADIVKDEG